jgi:hypothetical protein
MAQQLLLVDGFERGLHLTVLLLLSPANVQLAAPEDDGEAALPWVRLDRCGLIHRQSLHLHFRIELGWHSVSISLLSQLSSVDANILPLQLPMEVRASHHHYGHWRCCPVWCPPCL